VWPDAHVTVRIETTAELVPVLGSGEAARAMATEGRGAPLSGLSNRAPARSCLFTGAARPMVPLNTHPGGGGSDEARRRECQRPEGSQGSDRGNDEGSGLMVHPILEALDAMFQAITEDS
jgi:hypothetical protein